MSDTCEKDLIDEFRRFVVRIFLTTGIPLSALDIVDEHDTFSRVSSDSSDQVVLEPIHTTNVRPSMLRILLQQHQYPLAGRTTMLTYIPQVYQSEVEVVLSV